MSTFDGIILEIPGISVDMFENFNLKSSAFFLSHYHTDHIQGLFNPEFIRRMQDDNVYLYASPITIRIIREVIKNDHCNRFEFKCRELQYYEAFIIELPETKENVRVTSMPAGHCMGSIMFLFETHAKNILYTGDFRLDPEVFKQLLPLLDNNSYKRIDNIYLDTTFFNESYKEFPKRTKLMPKLLDAINDWLNADPIQNEVFLITPAYYSYECLFQEIWKALKVKVCVPYKLACIYDYLPELDDVFAKNSNETKISASTWGYFDNNLPSHVRCFKFSAMRWANADKYIERSLLNENYYFMCYSTHASYNEIMEILQDLKPLKITPCVIPTGNDQKVELFGLIENVLQSIHVKSSCESELTFKMDQFYDYDNKLPNDCLNDLPGSPPR